MTPQEHLFMLLLFARQNAKFNTLVEVLRASGVVLSDDLEAYRNYTREEKPEQLGELVQQAWAAYQATAASLGITTGLEHGPFLPKK